MREWVVCGCIAAFWVIFTLSPPFIRPRGLSPARTVPGLAAASMACNTGAWGQRYHNYWVKDADIHCTHHCHTLYGHILPRDSGREGGSTG